jgi:hypothetical protein
MMKAIKSDIEVSEMYRLAEEKGMTVQEVSPGHYHVINGDVLVNYWPCSKQRSAHVKGHKKGLVHCSAEDVIKLAAGTFFDEKDMQKPPKAVPCLKIVTGAVKASTGATPPWDMP